MAIKHLLRKLLGAGQRGSGTPDSYYGDAACCYDARREPGPKWAFEQDSLQAYLQDIAAEVASVLDAPVGTGRFLESYLNTPSVAAIHGFDLSADMLRLARSRTPDQRVQLYRHDVVRHPLPLMADLVVSFRFLNLLAPAEARLALTHLLAASRKYAVISCRLVGPHHRGEIYIENKIHLHADSDWQASIGRLGFVVADQRTFADERPGQYHSVLLRRRTHLDGVPAQAGSPP